MREAVFLRQNAERWKQFETLLADPRAGGPDALADLYVQVTDDLSYAQTFYPGSKTTAYLNELASRAHRRLYRNRREDAGRFWRFWRTELPLAVRQAHPQLALALAIFLLAVGIGLLSSARDDGFVRLIMSDKYVNMTLDNIDRDDPMAVYKQMNPLDMAAYITLNNVKVSFLAFAMGMLFAVGTAYVLFVNGVMVGAFHHLFYQEGLLGPAMRVIYIHGALELPAIVIAGGAGFVLGRSLLFPGTFSRLDALTRAARHGLKIVVGLVPVFIVAGTLEGFVTRWTEMPLWVSAAIIGGSLAFIAWYFWLYPLRVARRVRSG